MIQACNNFVWIIRDEAASEIGGLLLPESAKEKPHTGIIFSVGEMVQDKKIKKDKRAIFFKGNGWDVTHNGETYLVIEGERIIGIE